MTRSDIIKVALAGDLGKPRPALVVQSDAFSENQTLVILPLTSDLTDIPFVRLTVDPSPLNGLRRRSQIMVDKMTIVRREKIGGLIGQLDRDTMAIVDKSLALFLGLA